MLHLWFIFIFNFDFFNCIKAINSICAEIQPTVWPTGRDFKTRLEHELKKCEELCEVRFPNVSVSLEVETLLNVAVFPCLNVLPFNVPLIFEIFVMFQNNSIVFGCVSNVFCEYNIELEKIAENNFNCFFFPRNRINQQLGLLVLWALFDSSSAVADFIAFIACKNSNLKSLQQIMQMLTYSWLVWKRGIPGN